MGEAMRTYLAAEAASRFGSGSQEHLTALAAGQPYPEHTSKTDDRRTSHSLPPTVVAKRPRKDVSPFRLLMLGMDI